MRILLASKHRYPASVGGLSGARVLDWLAKGLGELGHEVFYQLSQGAVAPLPDRVTLISERRRDVDILHLQDWDPINPASEAGNGGRPWVRTCHGDLGPNRHIARDNWIFVSPTHAAMYGRQRYVINGIDPSELRFSATKDDYFLFLTNLERLTQKGFDLAMALSKRPGFHLVVAGSSPDQRLTSQFQERCRQRGIEYVGEVYGTRKAELFARAKALLFPSQLNEACPLVVAEALMSGTPVICSNKGFCPQMVSPEVGVVCASEADYLRAIERVGELSPQACREKAMRDYHYLRMAADYVREYEREICALEGRGC